jgi:CTP-dependent riboflavin kinase
MTEEEGKKFVSIGMFAAYSDMADKLARKLQMLEKAKVMFPQHADYYDSVIEIISDEHAYAQNMARVGREMHGETLQ